MLGSLGEHRRDWGFGAQVGPAVVQAARLMEVGVQFQGRS